jgi:hypothetical protein
MDGEQMRRRRLPFFFVAVVVTALSVPAASLAGPDVTTMKLGSAFTITGKTGSVAGTHARATGKVVVSGRWDDGRWHVLVALLTDHAGNYTFTIRPHHRGRLLLRIAPPDHHSRRYLLHVY